MITALYSNEEYLHNLELMLECELQYRIVYNNTSVSLVQENVIGDIGRKITGGWENIRASLDNIQNSIDNKISAWFTNTKKMEKEIDKAYSNLAPEQKRIMHQYYIYTNENFSKVYKNCLRTLDLIIHISNNPEDDKNKFKIEELKSLRLRTKLRKLEPVEQEMTTEKAYKYGKSNLQMIQKLVDKTRNVKISLDQAPKDSTKSKNIIRYKRYCYTILTHVFHVIDKMEYETILGTYDIVTGKERRLRSEIISNIIKLAAKSIEMPKIKTPNANVQGG